jgi:membrane protein implicated in regulation of membrane protease activity
MGDWILWVIVAGVFGAGEVISGSSFYLAPFAVGALLAGGADAAVGEPAGWIVFLGATILTLLTVRPLVQHRLMSGPQLRTGAAALVGKRAVVLERIDNDAGVGQVRIDHDVWTARCYEEDHAIEPGTTVQVVEIKGATALVME